MKYKRETKKSIMDGLDISEIAKSKMLDHATVEYYLHDGTRIIRYHQTDILKFHPDGTVAIFNGGWFTRTTATRIDTYLKRGKYNGGVFTRNGIWYYHTGNHYEKNFKEYRFMEGMVIGIDAVPVNPVEGPDPAKSRLLKSIRKYTKGLKKWLENSRQDASQPHNIDMTGDCLLCQLEVQGHDQGCEHLEMHLQEKYYMWSLIINAMRWAGFDNMQIGVNLVFGMWRVPRTVSNYLKFRLGIQY